MIDRQPSACGRRFRAPNAARVRLCTRSTVIHSNSQKEKEAKRKTTADDGFLSQFNNRTFLLGANTGHFNLRLTKPPPILTKIDFAVILS